MKRITAMMMCLLMVAGVLLTSCGNQASSNSSALPELDPGTTESPSENLADHPGVEATTPGGFIVPDPKFVSIIGEDRTSALDFCVRLFQKSVEGGRQVNRQADGTEGAQFPEDQDQENPSNSVCYTWPENVMVSPLSVMYALSMTANGAREETLVQMEDVLGMQMDELNAYLKGYRSILPEDEKYKLSIANSIWLTDDDRFTVEDDFLKTNEEYYDAGIFKVPFNDATCKEINAWVEEHTDGMVKDILNKIPAEAVMYLVNAMAFDAEWQTIYKENQIRPGVFHAADGNEQEVTMMHSDEYIYLHDDDATGFVKDYADGAYAFVALLPNEGMSVDEYVQSLTADKLEALLSNREEKTVKATLPKFESEYATEMGELLQEMGMTDAFNEASADFTGLGTSTDGNLYISRVLHKTFIAVDERGTKAGAATVVEMAEGCAILEEEIFVTLDRPFVYMIIDTRVNMPLFMGVLRGVE